MRGTFNIPPLKPGHRYRLRVNDGQHVGAGGGHIIYLNGKPLIETVKGNGRGGGRVKGAYITRERFDELKDGEATFAVKTFIRFNDRYSAKPSSRVPQGKFSIHLDEQKLPPMGDDLVLKSATLVPMFSSAWQALQDPEDREQSESAPLFRYDGKFVAHPSLIGDWKLVAQVSGINDFDPTARAKKLRSARFLNLVLKDGGATTDPTLIWSDNILIDLDGYQALKMEIKQVDGKSYLFVEAGGFKKNNKPDWKTKYYVCRRQ
jgi:hypothetical protein